MDEEKETQAPQEEIEGKAEEAPTQTLFDKTEKIVEAQKQENDRREALIAREEDLFARKQLGGQSEAGKVAEKPAEETNEEFTERFEAGQVDLLK